MATKDNHAPYERKELDKYVSALFIPHNSIKELGFAQCKQPKQTVMSWYDDQKTPPDIVINGGLFNMKNGRNILSFVDEGKEQNYQNGFYGLGITSNDLTKLVFGQDNTNTWKDFMSAYPVLVNDGKIPDKYANANEINGKFARQAIGVTANYDVIIITADKPVASGAGVTFEQMSKYFVDLGARYAIGLDGGGSVYRLEYGYCTNNATETRPVDNVFYVKLKTSEEAKKDMITTGSIVYAHGEIKAYTGIETNNVIFTIPDGGEVAIRTPINHWNDKDWVCVSYDYQIGYIVYDGKNLVESKDVVDNNTTDTTVTPEPDTDKDTDEDTSIDDKLVELDTPEKYMVTASTGLNLRSGHATSYPVIGSVEEDMLLMINAFYDNGAWARVEYIDVDDASKYISTEAPEIWVYAKYLKKVEVEADNNKSDSSSDNDSGDIKFGPISDELKAELRKEIDHDAPVTFKYPMTIATIKPGSEYWCSFSYTEGTLIKRTMSRRGAEAFQLFRVIGKDDSCDVTILTLMASDDYSNYHILTKTENVIVVGVINDPNDAHDTPTEDPDTNKSDDNSNSDSSEDPEIDILDNYEDKDEISFWAVNAMRKCAERGYIIGYDGKLNPKAAVTKEELASVIARLI